jgi:hypothetical protein
VLAELQLLTSLIIDRISSADVSALLLAGLSVAAPSQSGPSAVGGDDERREVLAEL